MADASALRSLIVATFANDAFPKGVAPAEHQCVECDGIRKSFSGQAPFDLPNSYAIARQDGVKRWA